MAERNGIITGGKLPAWVFVSMPTIFILLVAVYPFLVLVHGNFSLSFFSEITGNSPTAQLVRRGIWNSITQGVLSALASFVVGLPLGIFLGRYEFRLKRALNSLILVPFFLPSLIVVFAVLSGFGNGSAASSILPFSGYLSGGLPGILVVNTFFNAPLVAFFTKTAVERADVSLEEAASTLNSSTFRSFYSLWGRDGIISGLGGAILAFIYSFTGFAAPLIIGGIGSYTLDAWIYFEYRTYNLPAAIFFSITEALILLIPAAIYLLYSSRMVRTTSTGNRERNGTPYRSLFFLAGIAYAILWVATEVYLLSSLIINSLEVRGSSVLGLDNYRYLVSREISSSIGISIQGAVMNTLFYGTVTATMVTAIGIVWVIGKRRLGGGKFLASESFQYVPRVISAVIMGFAILVVFGISAPGNLIWVLIVAAQASVAIPVVLRIIDNGFATIPVSQSEASMILKGIPSLEVELPLAKSAFATSLMFGFAISIGEFSSTNLLASGSFIPLTVMLYSLQGIRLFGPAYAVGTILLIISILAFVIIQKLGERFVAFR